MKTLKKIKFILIFLFLFPLYIHQTPVFSESVYKYNVLKDRLKYEFIYNRIIQKIKEHETFSGVRYHTGIDTDGWTIGYGHKIKATDNIPDTISEEYADSLLIKDFEGAIRMVKFYTPILNKEENKYKMLAMSHFVFAKGIGNFNKSKLKQLVEEEKPIDKEILKWIVVRKDGVIKYNQRMLKNRLLEIEIYNLQ